MEKRRLDPLPALILVLSNDVPDVQPITYISDSKFLIGRSNESSLKLRHKWISRKHCTLEKIGPLKWTITAHKTVSVNGCPLLIDEPVPLICSDKIKFAGIITFEFKCSLDQNQRCGHDLRSNIGIENSSISKNVEKFQPVCSQLPSASSSTSFESPQVQSVIYIPTEKVLKNDSNKNNSEVSNVTVIDPPSSVLDFGNDDFSTNIDDLKKYISYLENHASHESARSIESDDVCGFLLVEELKYRVNCLEHLHTDKTKNVLSKLIEKLSTFLKNVAMSNYCITNRNGANYEILLKLNALLLKEMKSLYSASNANQSTFFCKDAVENETSCACIRKKSSDQNSLSNISKLDLKDSNDKNKCIQEGSNILKEELKINKQNKDWQEAKIECLEMKVKETNKLKIELEAAKEENEILENKITELKRTIANMEVMELEYKYLQETTKYKEDDKRSKDALERSISNLTNDVTSLKKQNENLTSSKTALECDVATLMQKCHDLEEKLKIKCTNEAKTVFESGTKIIDDYGSDMVRELKSSLVDLMETEFNCSICGDMFIDATVTNCNHVFCAYCLKEWKKKKKQCPFCRTNITKECKATVIDECISNLSKLISEHMHNERTKLINERKVVGTPPVKRARTRGPTRGSVGANQFPNFQYVYPQQNPFIPEPFLPNPNIIHIP